MTRNLSECTKCHGFLPLLSPEDTAKRIDAWLVESALAPPEDPARGHKNGDKLILLRAAMHQLACQLRGLCQLCAPPYPLYTKEPQ